MWAGGGKGAANGTLEVDISADVSAKKLDRLLSVGAIAPTDMILADFAGLWKIWADFWRFRGHFRGFFEILGDSG